MESEFSFNYPAKGYLSIPNFKKLETIYPNWKCDVSDILYSIVSKLGKASVHHTLYRFEAEIGSYVYKLYSMLVKDGINGEVLDIYEMLVGINDIKDFSNFVNTLKLVEVKLVKVL